MSLPRIAGIDLGTTYTAAAIVDDGRPVVVHLGNRAAPVPTLVHLSADGTFSTGEVAERRATGEPGRLAREFKTRVGDPTPVLLGGTPVGVDNLMAHVLRDVVTSIVGRLGARPDEFVLTHPATWGEYKLDVLRSAARIAGLGECRLVPEPVAAAVWYATTNRVEVGQTMAVYDLGGGTFDAAVLERTGAGFSLRGRPEGLDRLGGVDFDRAVLDHVLGQVRDGGGPLDPEDPATTAALVRLRRDCVEAKEGLSVDTSVTIPVSLPGIQREVRVTRAELEARLRPVLGETVAALARALEAAGTTADDLATVLLIGGSSRIPLVSELLGSELGRPVSIDADPKLAVALGAVAYRLAELGQGPGTPPAPAPAPVPVSAPAAQGPVPPAPTPAPPALPPARPMSFAVVSPPPAPATQSATASPRVSIGRRRTWWIAAVVAVALLGVGLTAFLLGQRSNAEFGTVQVAASDAGCRLEWTADDWQAGDVVVFVLDGQVLEVVSLRSGTANLTGSVTDIRHLRDGTVIGESTIEGC